VRRVLLAAIVTLTPVALTGCGGGGEDEAGPAATTGGVTTTQRPATTQAGATGNPARGKTVFTEAGCGQCHTFAAADANGATGPNLDELEGEEATPQALRISILDPAAEIEEGYPNVMPKNYDQRLSTQQVDDLVAFLSAK